MLTVVALVGRPNVGKSTLFNVLTASRDALVTDKPGVTRDRHHGVCRLDEHHPFAVIDTAGLTDPDNDLDQLMGKQVQHAIDEAQLLLFVLDARTGWLPSDRAILDALRRSGKTIIVAINKTEALNPSLVLAEFAPCGINPMLPLSAAHNRGIETLLAALVPHMLPDQHENTEIKNSITVAIVGRPNTGKSTLVNRLLGEDRLIVSNLAGTTRDSIAVALQRDGTHCVLIDTAGVRRKSGIVDAIERFSMIKTRQSISAAQVVIVMIDARENLVEQDLTLIGHVLEQGKALVIAINKWDGLDAYQRQQCRRVLQRRLVFVNWSRPVFISALHGSGLNELMCAITRVHAASTRSLTSSSLTRTLEKACRNHQPRLVRGHAPKLRFAHPGGTKPPTVIIYGTRTQHVDAAYRRYLENFFRSHHRLEGTPIRIEFRENKNPYIDHTHVAAPRRGYVTGKRPSRRS